MSLYTNAQPVLFLTVTTHTVGMYSPGKDFSTYVINRQVFPTPLYEGNIAWYLSIIHHHSNYSFNTIFLKGLFKIKKRHIPSIISGPPIWICIRSTRT